MFTGEHLLAWMYWVEMVNIFALLSDGRKRAETQMSLAESRTA